MEDHDKEFIKNIGIWGVICIILATILIWGINQAKEIPPSQERPNSMAMISGNTLVGVCQPAGLKPSVLTSLVDDIVTCESQWRKDAVGEAGEIGVAQFMPATWEWMSGISGIKGDLHDTNDQIRMLRWALQNGYAYHWTCYRSLTTE